jgi:uncharacterized repeat protein (TIGR03803 family)
MLRDSSRMFANRFFSTLAMILLMAVSAWAGAYKVMYYFHSSNANPSSGLVLDAKGNVYGTTLNGGESGGGGEHNSGAVYELSPTTGYHLLYEFAYKGVGGWHPQGNLVLDSAGNLYGTTLDGGANKTGCNNDGCGVVFELSPPSYGGLWTETVLYSFCSQANCADGANPGAGVIFDSTGNLYGTTGTGGIGPNCLGGCGTVFELSRSGSGWTESVLCAFATSACEGEVPSGNLVFDTVGNLYGTTSAGGAGGRGAVFELSPLGNSWTQTLLYSFSGFSGSTDGYDPRAGLVFDPAGNLYGTTYAGGENLYYGTVFELSPSPGNWTETIIYNFGGGSDGAYPESSLVFDSSGNLYGTTFGGGESEGCLGYGCGTVFKLTPDQSNQWTETLFRFPADGNLGTRPTAPVLLDAAGNAYGTTSVGGYRNDFGFLNDGVIFRIEQ